MWAMREIKWRSSQLLYYSTCTFYAWCPNYLTFNVRSCDRNNPNRHTYHYEYECVVSVLFTPIGIEVACIILTIVLLSTWTARNTPNNGWKTLSTNVTGMTRIGRSITRHHWINKFIGGQAKNLGTHGKRGPLCTSFYQANFKSSYSRFSSHSFPLSHTAKSIPVLVGCQTGTVTTTNHQLQSQTHQ